MPRLSVSSTPSMACMIARRRVRVGRAANHRVPARHHRRQRADGAVTDEHDGRYVLCHAHVSSSLFAVCAVSSDLRGRGMPMPGFLLRRIVALMARARLGRRIYYTAS